MRAFFIILFSIFFLKISGFSQLPSSDTLKITIQEAEDRFLRKNLGLVIQHFNIENAEAQLITAHLFQNPQFNFSGILYNPTTKRILGFHQGDSIAANNGEYALGISQLFFTARKRNKNIQLANAVIQQNTYQFYELLRTLRYTLRNDFFNIYFQQQSKNVYVKEINSLQQILDVFKEQYAKGFLAQKEVLRIQSRLYSLQAEYSSLLLSIENTEVEFKMLIRAIPTTNIVAVYNYNLQGKQTLTSVPYQQLLDSAFANRTDLKLAEANTVYNDINLKVQKALAWPDVTASLGFDKLGSYQPNYNSIGVAFNLPFFNRNQGAIKAARVVVEQGKTQLQQQQNQVEYDVSSNYKISLELERLTNGFDPKFAQDYSHLIDEVLKNYTTRNIGLLDFLNYYDDFKNNTILLNTALSNRVTSLEKLNFVTGTTFFNK